MAQAQKVSWFKRTIASAFGSDRVDEVDRSGYSSAESMTTSSLLGNGVTGARTREVIYGKYQQMQADPVVAGALRMHVTGALGGDDATGDMVFIEPTAVAKEKDKAGLKLALEVSADLHKTFNSIAMAAAYNGVTFGDAYARLYTEKRRGVVAASVDELMLPPLIQPYEVGTRTVVCVAAIGPKLRERLVMDQIARLKMPRMIYTPQPLAVEKAWRVRIAENDASKLPVMPSLVGGSFLAEAEGQYDRFVTALNSLVTQRVLDSIDESIFTGQVTGMTKEQQQEFSENFRRILLRSKEVADEAIASGKPFFGRLRHFMPVWNEKQIFQVQGVNSSGGSGGGRAGNVSIEDVLFQAKLLAGALGIDLSMLGFADMLSGGMGDGGFFRTSVQAAERARSLRTAMVDFFNHIADVHVAYKYGIQYEEGKRPWQINFYGSIAAMETEKQKTRTEAANTALLVCQVLAQAKDAGLDEKATAHLLERELKLEKADAAMYAKAITAAREAEEKKNQGGAGFGGGGFGG